jgi:colicin import membrane protein
MHSDPVKKRSEAVRAKWARAKADRAAKAEAAKLKAASEAREQAEAWRRRDERKAMDIAATRAKEKAAAARQSEREAAAAAEKLVAAKHAAYLRHVANAKAATLAAKKARAAMLHRTEVVKTAALKVTPSSLAVLR